MKFFWFERGYPIPGGISARSKELENHGFNGTMYPYGIFSGDYFIRISRNIDISSSFEYIVAIRPYTISAQYLSMLCSSINEISKNRISINLLTGWIYEDEKSFGGILSDINDSSSNIERSNYMIKYAKEFKRISKTKFYISTTNDNIFDKCDSYKFPMIIPYSWYKSNRFNLSDHTYIVSLAPVIDNPDGNILGNQDGDIFTEDEFFSFLNDCMNKSVHGILLQESKNNTEYKNIISYVKKYKEQYP